MTINIVSIILFALAGICLVVAIYSFIRFNIPRVIGELTGRTAKKSIAQMREKNAKTGDKSHSPSAESKERGTLTDKIDEKEVEQTAKTSDSTELLDEGTELLSNQYDNDENGTELLNDNATEILNDETSVLSEKISALSPSMLESTPIQSNDGFKMIQDIIFIHTNEII
ncbi:MAG: hypothetical protein ACLUFN_01655 [Eubacterium sp.]